MTQRGGMALRWALRVIGVSAIAFVTLTAVYAQFMAPTVDENGVTISQEDTADRYLVASGLATNCLFTGENSTEQRHSTQPTSRSLLEGTTFSPPGQAGTLTCERELRVVSGVAAKLAQVAEHEFLIAFPGVLLVAIAQVVGPPTRGRARRS